MHAWICAAYGWSRRVSRRRPPVVAAALVAGAVVVATTVAVSAEPEQRVVAAATTVGSIDYVALGSSYAAGPGSPKLLDKGCLRAADNYPHRVASARGLRLTDVSCSSATTANILRTAQRPHATKPQITAVTATTDLVTITIGGNDLRYIGRVADQVCVHRMAAASLVSSRSTPSGCRAGRVPAPEPSAADYADVERSMVAIVDAVRSRAPRARIVFVDYPPLVDPRAPFCSAVPLTPAEIAETTRVHAGLVAATARAARSSGALLATASAAGAAHTACSSSPWLWGIDTPSAYHLTPVGKAGVARQVLDVLRRAEA